MADLDPAKWKDVTVSRGANYHYYYAPASEGKLTILFVHGFPSLARDWRKISLSLEASGYGILLPDQYGYGGTDKPTDPAQYRLKLLSQDLVDLLDAEGIKKVVAVGHDWGSFVASRLANYHPDRFHAYAYFAVPFGIPDPSQTLESIVTFMESVIGYNPYGYWNFFNEDDADQIMKEHVESSTSITYAKDLSIWRDIVCPVGALKKALLADYKPPGGIGSYMSEEDLKVHLDVFSKNGIAGPLCYYKAEVRGLNKPDEDALPAVQRLPPVSAPIFFGVGEGDVVCTPKVGRLVFGLEPFQNHNITINEYSGDHWLIMSNADEIVKDLEAWITGVVEPTVKA